MLALGEPGHALADFPSDLPAMAEGIQDPAESPTMSLSHGHARGPFLTDRVAVINVLKPCDVTSIENPRVQLDPVAPAEGRPARSRRSGFRQGRPRRAAIPRRSQDGGGTRDRGALGTCYIPASETRTSTREPLP